MGKVGQPPKLRKRLNALVTAFRKPSRRASLPSSIQGLWKADLFLGSTNTQQWVGTTVKINQQQLEGARGLRVGIIPTKQGKTDLVRLDDNLNLILCPLQHDADFMQAFYEAWRVVQAFVASDAKLPKEAFLPRPVDREICRLLEERREFPVVDVIEALAIFSQPELMEDEVENVNQETIKGESETFTVIAPTAQAVPDQ